MAELSGLDHETRRFLPGDVAGRRNPDRNHVFGQADNGLLAVVAWLAAFQSGANWRAAGEHQKHDE